MNPEDLAHTAHDVLDMSLQKLRAMYFIALGLDPDVFNYAALSASITWVVALMGQMPPAQGLVEIRDIVRDDEEGQFDATVLEFVDFMAETLQKWEDLEERMAERGDQILAGREPSD